MHKPTRTRLTVTEGHTDDPKVANHAPFKKRSSQHPRNWNRVLKRVALCLFIAEAGVLLLANPALRVTQVRVEGAQTLTPDQVYAEAKVPHRTNIFWMLRQPFAKRLQADPLIDHASCSIELPHRLVLRVTERQPRAVLAAAGRFWLLDKTGVPYQELDRPLAPLPIIQAAPSLLPAEMPLGKPLGNAWLPDALRLLALLGTAPNLGGAKIVVDQNLNLCLNRRNEPQIRLGQPDALPLKVTLASETLGALSRQAAYIDVSCPQQPVFMPLKETGQDTDQGAEAPRRDRNGHDGPEPHTN